MTQDEFTIEEIKEFKIFTKEQMEKEIQEMFDEKEKIDSRSNDLKIVHEDIVLIERLNYGDLFSSVFTLSDSVASYDRATGQTRHVNTKEARLKDSWLARVIKTSTTISMLDVVESKKKTIAKDDIIYINSESAYGLNVRHAETFLKDIDVYGRIWAVSINNVLHVDEAFNFYKVKEALIRGRHVQSLESARIARQEKAERSDLGKSRLV